MTKRPMSSALLEIYEALDRECTFLHAKWQIFKELYAEGKEKIEILNASAGAFFGYIRRILPEDVGIGIARITDPAQTGSRHNLSLRRLQSVVEAEQHTELSQEISTAVREAEDAVSPLRHWRNKGLAHLDLPTAIDRDNNPLPHVKLADVDRCLECIAKTINTVSQFFEGRTSAYKPIVMPKGTYWLLHYLRLGLEKHEEGQRQSPVSTKVEEA